MSQEDTYHGDYALDPALVRCFPGGSKFITSRSGTIYTRDLKYERELASRYSNKYLDFTFNNTGTRIYAAVNEQKKVEEISYPAGTVAKTYPTLFFPLRVFRDGKQLICLTTTGSHSGGYFIIEKINL